MHRTIVVTPEQMKFLEAEADRNGVSYEKMMENAGVCLYFRTVGYLNELNKTLTRKSKIIFLCGNGNNAGDCFYTAQMYKEANNADVLVFLLCGQPKTPLAKLNFERMKDIPVIEDEAEMLEILETHFLDLKIDGVFGTGFHGELPENVKRIFSACKGTVVAADVPSGGNCKTGAVADGTLKVNETVAFGGRKFGMTQYPLKEYCGHIRGVGIGITDDIYNKLDYPIMLPDDETVKEKIPKRKPDSHKGDYGRLVTVCGSINMPGAAIMSACAAARTGVGLLTVCTPREYLPHFAAKLPESVYLPLDTTECGTYTADSCDIILKTAEKATAVLIGCGLGVSNASRELVKRLLLEIRCPIILDADGINCITDSIDIIKQAESLVILTPHPAEMARLCKVTTAEIQSDRLEYAKNFAQQNNCVVILKGAGTVIAYPDKAFVCEKGNPGMSKGGSGDVLSGIVASLTAQSVACENGVYIHGLAGDRAAEKYSQQSMLPTDIINELGGIFKDYER